MFANDDDMVECPYNSSHRMLRKRLQSHLLKCRVHYPDVELRKCPFNLSHLIPEPEFTHHVTNCPDRKLITQYKYDAPEVVEEDHPKHKPIESEENWDETDVPDYDPAKYAENATVIRLPVGTAPSERKEFIKKERKRLGDIDTDEENESGNHNSDDTTVQLQNVYSRNRSRSKTPEPVFRNSSPPRPIRNDRRTYNCDEDPYYNRNSEQRRNRSSPLSNRGSSPAHSSRDRPPSRSYRDDRSHKDRRSPMRSKKDQSPPGSYRDRSPTRSHRDRPPSQSYRGDRSPSRRDNRTSNSSRKYWHKEDSRYRGNSPTNNRRHNNYNMGSGSSNTENRDDPGPRTYFTANHK